MHLSVLAYLTGAFVDELAGAAALGLGGAADDGDIPAREAEAKAEQRLGAILDAMRRLALDFSTLVHHVPAAYHLLSAPELWGEAFLGRFVTPLQAMLPHRRKVTGDVEERSGFRVPMACSAEFVVNACVTELLTTLAGLRPAAAARGSGGGGESRAGSSGGSDEERIRRVDLLYGAARQALEACEEWCGDRLARSRAVVAAEPGGGSGPSPPRRLCSAADLYEGLLDGELEASPHLPLHRTAAAFVQALLSLEQQGGPTGRVARAQVQQLLSLRASLDGGTAWRSLSRFLLLGQAFISQVIARRWLRNGDDMSQVELFVLNGRELTDLDVLMTQCWMAAEDPDVVLYDTLSAMGAQPLLAAAGVTAPQESHHTSAGLFDHLAGPAAPQRLHCAFTAAACSEALRWLVSLLRERRVAGLEPRERLRCILVQWLALRDWTYNQLHDLLPQDLQQQPPGVLEEVLSQVATFRAASLAQARQYSLRREAWVLFCPAFVHYTPSMRSRAWEAAMTAARAAGGGGTVAAVYEAHWQLRRPRHRLPRSLAGLQRVLDCGGMWRLVGWVLRTALSGAPRLPEDTLLGALNLLALQLHRLEDLLVALQSRSKGNTSANADVTTGMEEEGKHAEGKRGSPVQVAGAQQQGKGQDGEDEDVGITDESQLRAAAATGAAALAGAVQRPAAPQTPGSAAPQSSSASAAASCPEGILGLLEALLQSQTPPDSSQRTHREAAAARLSSETMDCLQWLWQTARGLVRTGEEAGVLAAAGTPAADAAAEPAVAELGAPGAVAAAGEASAGGAAAEAEAARRRELARQRQAAMMARLREQQLAFLRKAAGQGADGTDSSDEDEEHSEEEQDKEQMKPATVAEETASGDLGEEMQDGQQRQQQGDASGPPAGARSGGGGESAREGDAASSNDGATDDSDEDRDQVRDGARHESGRSDDAAASGGDGGGGDGDGRRRQRRRTLPGAASACPAATASAAARQQLPLGRWMPVDVPEPECAVCREGTAGGRHGPLALIAHTAVCSCTATPLRQARAWDDDVEAQAAEPTSPRAGLAAAPASQGTSEAAALTGPSTAPSDPRVGDGSSSGGGGASTSVAGLYWRRSWRLHEPSVSEAPGLVKRRP